MRQKISFAGWLVVLWLALAAVVLSGCSPQPIGPGPGPGPSPGPDVGALVPGWFVVVEDKSARTKEIAEVVAHPTYWAGLEASGHRFALVDVRNADSQRYTNQVESAGIPCLIIMRAADSKVMGFGRLPGSVGEIDALARKVLR